MNIVVMFTLIVFAILLWWVLLQKLKAKPWLIQGVELEPINSLTFYPPKVIGLGVFLAVVTALFVLFSAAYHMRMAVPDWTHLPLPKILWLNTALLVLSSVALQYAWSYADKFSPADKTNQEINNIRHGLLAGVCLALAFLAGQLLAWRQLDGIGFFFSCSPASAFFYLFTGLHGLHLLGGLIVLSKTTKNVYREDFSHRAIGINSIEHVGKTLLSIKLCAIYWHYLLLIWLGIYALLLST